jgi:hypothetical protein
MLATHPYTGRKLLEGHIVVLIGFFYSRIRVPDMETSGWYFGSDAEQPHIHTPDVSFGKDHFTVLSIFLYTRTQVPDMWRASCQLR